MAPAPLGDSWKQEKLLHPAKAPTSEEISQMEKELYSTGKKNTVISVKLLKWKQSSQMVSATTQHFPIVQQYGHGLGNETLALEVKLRERVWRWLCGKKK